MSNPLEAVSNAIELKPGRKYLLVFKGVTSIFEVEHAVELLRSQGIYSIGISLDNDQDMQVIEVPNESKEQERG